MIAEAVAVSGEEGRDGVDGGRSGEADEVVDGVDSLFGGGAHTLIMRPSVPAPRQVRLPPQALRLERLL